jgi:hypothetical protein
MEYPINQNKGRYTISKTDWVVSSVGDSPNRNTKGEIKPLKFTKGKVNTETLKAVLDVDGIIVQTGEFTLVSKKTLTDIQLFNNPHWDFLSNGTLIVKDKSVTLGKTIPTIRISIEKFPTIGGERDIANLNAGVKEAEYIYEGEKTEGVPNNLIEQINYTLNEDSQRPGDTFSIYDLQLGSDSVYSVNELVISKLQEDGKFDKEKLTSFMLEIESRLKVLNDDFQGIKNTFYSGVPPISKGVKLYTNEIADSNSDVTFEGSSYLTETSKILTVEPTPKDKVVDATTKVIETKTTSVEKKVEEQRQELASTQQRQTLAQQQLQSDLNQQAQRTDEYYKKLYGGAK